MADTMGAAVLDAASPASWAMVPFETLFSLSKDEVEAAQREALTRRFETLRPHVAALDNLASRQRVERVETPADAVPVFFDHRVYKSYPLSLIERRRFDQLTAWLQRLTAREITSVPLDGVRSVDSWIDRLDEHGMLVCHTTGTSGKLSFIPRSQAEWPPWAESQFEVHRMLTGVDRRTEQIPYFNSGYRNGHWHAVKVDHRSTEMAAGGNANRHVLYDFALSSDLLSLAARLQAADEQGRLDELDIDPEILEARARLIERSRHREDDLQRWFFKLAQEYRGQRVHIGGIAADMVRLARRAGELGIVCEFAPDSIFMTGGGMKGLKDPPADWEQYVKDAFGVQRLSMQFGMSECLGVAPRCEKGCYHFFPYTLPLVLDEDFVALPQEGVQTGRLALFDFLADTYWGGFISGDRVTLHWDYACECGLAGPRLEPQIVRFSELEGGQDDKLTCAGTAEAYNGFMDYVGEI